MKSKFNYSQQILKTWNIRLNVWKRQKCSWRSRKLQIRIKSRFNPNVLILWEKEWKFCTIHTTHQESKENTKWRIRLFSFFENSKNWRKIFNWRNGWLITKTEKLKDWRTKFRKFNSRWKETWWTMVQMKIWMRKIRCREAERCKTAQMAKTRQEQCR